MKPVMSPAEFQAALAQTSKDVQALNRDLARVIPGPNECQITAGGLVKPCPKLPRKRIRQSSKPLLNKLEAEYQLWVEANTEYKLIPQAIRFRLGNGIWYKPDFTILVPYALMAIEVKGPHAFRGGLENLKVAASLYPQVWWKLVWKEGNHWYEQRVLP